MDPQTPTNPEIRQLIRLSAAARSHLEREALVIRHRLDVPARIRESVKNQPLGWLLGSLGAGLAASLLVRRNQPAPTKKIRGFKGRLLALALTTGRPLVKVWLARRLKHWAAAAVANRLAGASNRPSSSNTKSATFSHVHSQGSRSR